VTESVDAIESILSDCLLRFRLQHRGRERAGGFTWAASAAQLHELYSSLL
jgi:glycosyltransferase involved in cell wall biosynthesis